MATQNEPFVGDWYRDIEGKTFEIVAMDESANTVELQYFDGDVEEVELDDWLGMELEAIAAPEDWSGPYDNIVAEDFGDTEKVMHPEEWGGPLDELDREEH